jgi:hypothetical protein
MNTNTFNTNIDWPTVKAASSGKSWSTELPLNRVTHFSTRLFLAAVPALGMIVAASWAIGSESTAAILQAAMWATGFIFLALAIETRKASFTALLLTGLALPALALMSAHVATEFAIVAATLVAGWTATAIMKL